MFFVLALFKPDMDYSSENAYEQIEYDMEVSSTKSGKKQTDSLSKNKKKQQTLLIEANAFRGITIKEGGRFIVNIKNSPKIEFSSRSLSGDENKYLSSSSVLFSVENSDTVVFRSQCAKNWRANTPDYDYDTYYNSNQVRAIENLILMVFFN